MCSYLVQIKCLYKGVRDKYWVGSAGTDSATVTRRSGVVTVASTMARLADNAAPSRPTSLRVYCATHEHARYPRCQTCCAVTSVTHWARRGGGQPKHSTINKAFVLYAEQTTATQSAVIEEENFTLIFEIVCNDSFCPYILRYITCIIHAFLIFLLYSINSTVVRNI